MEKLIVFIILTALGFFVGRHLEKKHYRSLQEREEKFRNLPTIALKNPIVQGKKVVGAKLVTGSVVISIDHFKRLLAGLRNIFGGKVSSYETLLDRARREAILRMKESCPKATEIINVRLETLSISKGTKGGNVGSVEVLAYGTALKIQ